MNKSTDNNFQWDDNLVKEFTEYVGLRVGKNHDIREQINYLCEDFKKIYLPSQPTEQTTLSSKGDKEWEIESCKMGNTVYTKHGHELNNYYVNELVKRKQATIHSVRRLTDNTIWVVGENTNKGIIKSFVLHPDISEFYLQVNVGDQDTLLRTLCKVPNTNVNTYPITGEDDKVTREELLEAEHKAFYAAREDYDRGGCSPKMRKYPTFSDYKDSQTKK